MDVNIENIGGNCPVQAEGFVDGKPFYFRARGQQWSLGIGADPIGNPDWIYSERYSDEPYAAGWMTVAEARDFIAKAFALYESGAPLPVNIMNEPGYSEGWLAGLFGEVEGERIDSDAWRLGLADGEKHKKSQDELMERLKAPSPAPDPERP
jgi:hypothetical protein